MSRNSTEESCCERQNDMGTGTHKTLEIKNADLFETDERYHFKLSDILRKRHRPLIMMINQACELQYSSVPVEAPAREHRLIELALKEVQALFLSEFQASKGVQHLVVDKPGERCALVILENQLYSLRLFPFYGPIEGMMLDLYALLIEPVVKPVPHGVEFERVQKKFALSNRETDVLKALMSGDTDKVIAQSLGLSVETVRAYLKTVRVKLAVTTRTAVVHRVHEMLDGDPLTRN